MHQSMNSINLHYTALDGLWNQHIHYLLIGVSIIIIWNSQVMVSMSCREMLGGIKMWTSCFEATSCQDECHRVHLRAGTRWEALARKGTVRRGTHNSSINSNSTVEGQGLPKHCRNHLFLWYVRKRDSKVEWVFRMFGLPRSTVHLTCWICRGHQLIVKIIWLCFALLRY